MHGNVWEWCQDYWDPRFTSDAVTDPKGPASGKYRVSRGGCLIGGPRPVARRFGRSGTRRGSVTATVVSVFA